MSSRCEGVLAALLICSLASKSFLSPRAQTRARTRAQTRAQPSGAQGCKYNNCQGEGNGALCNDVRCAPFVSPWGGRYDARNYGTGPFATFTLGHGAVSSFLGECSVASRALCAWSSLSFSPDEAHLAASGGGVGLLLDAYSGALVHAMHGGGAVTDEKEGATSFNGCFTPDGSHVLCGTSGSSVCAWAVPQGNPDGPSAAGPATTLEGHAGPVGCVATSPTLGVVASACSVVALWTSAELGGGEGGGEGMSD